MDHTLDEAICSDEQQADRGRRHLQDAKASLILNELDPKLVIQQPEADAQPVDLITFGSVRETCPKCPRTHLKLVLRQQNVRLAHLFCPGCNSCYDAHYADGSSALTI